MSADRAFVLKFDPRSKILLLIISILSASMSPLLIYNFALVVLVALFGIVSGRVKYSLIGIGLYIFICFMSLKAVQTEGNIQTMFLAFFGLVHKVYPCAMMSGIVIATTKVNEFLYAMNRAHFPEKLTIPLAIMLRYIPAIKDDWAFIKDAMKMRGINPSLKNFLKNPAETVNGIYVPLMMSASKAADELTIASVTRGIENPAPRTCLVDTMFGIKDYLAVLMFVLIFAAGRFV